MIVIISFVVWRRSELFVLAALLDRRRRSRSTRSRSRPSPGCRKLPETIEAVAMPAVANLVGTGRGRAHPARLLARDAAARARRRFRSSRAWRSPGRRCSSWPTAPTSRTPGRCCWRCSRRCWSSRCCASARACSTGSGGCASSSSPGAGARRWSTSASRSPLIPWLDALGAAIANGAAILVAGVPCLVFAARLHRPVVSRLGRSCARWASRLAVAGAARRGCCSRSGPARSPRLLGAIAGGARVLRRVAALLRPLAREPTPRGWPARSGGVRRARRGRSVRDAGVAQ